MRRSLLLAALLWPSSAWTALVAPRAAPSPVAPLAPLASQRIPLASALAPSALSALPLLASPLAAPPILDSSLSLDVPASPTAELGALGAAAASAPQAAQALSAAFDGAAPPQASFFFNDHDASASYAAPLKAFVDRHDEILVEMAKPGRELSLYQAVSDGKLTPAQGRKKLHVRAGTIESAILEAVYGTRRLMRAEAIHHPENSQVRSRIDEELMPKASELLEQAYSEFMEEGDAKASAKTLHRFNTVMVEVHTLREKALVSDLSERLKQPGSVGVIFGMFHTQPYQALKRAGFRVAREFHPTGKGGTVTFSPMINPLRRLRFHKPGRDQELATKETLSFLLFHFFLDPLFRMDRFADRKDEIESAILARMNAKDFQRLADEASAYAAEKGDAEIGDRRVALFILRWLGEEGFLKPEEAGFFRRR